jgi:alkylation response protein AidB-like acyl-CoA dehydrogenase
LSLLVEARAPDADWRKAWRLAFAQLRQEVDLHPVGATPAAIFEEAARTTRAVAADCLPLAMGLVMHLYPLCALRCVPLPWWSGANYRRLRLLRTIDRNGLILANAGSERVTGRQSPVTLTRAQTGVRVDGTFDYVSLANVADLVLFNAPLPDGASLFCIAELRAGSARIGAPRFNGTMQLSDTCSLTFEKHLVPDGRFVVIPNDTSLGCMTQYQRNWFQLLAAEAHLARLEFLRKRWRLPRTAEEILGLHELALLREFSLRLLDDATQPSAIEKLASLASSIKLRVSWHCQALASALAEWDAAAAAELRCLERQPLCDDRILRGICEASVSQPLVVNQRRCPLRTGLAGGRHAAKAAT